MERSLPGIKVVTLDCRSDEEKMTKWKNEQRERKKTEGKGMIAVQGDSGSISSSDEEDLDDQQQEYEAGARPGKKAKAKGMVNNIRKGEREREERETADDMGTSSAQ